MRINHRLLIITCLIFIVLAVLSQILSLIFNWNYNISWPIVIIMLGVLFYVLVNTYFKGLSWADLLYIPGSILLSLGIIFLLNIVTGDWNSWAYAWLLVIAGAGAGVVLSNRNKRWRREVSYAGAATAIGGVTLSMLFGAIAGGLFLSIMSLVLLILGGIALLWWQPEMTFPGKRLKWCKPGHSHGLSSKPQQDPRTTDALLSTRELEVLTLISQGLSNDEIAERLSVANSTVKTHINNIYSKLGVRTRVQALKQADKLGLPGL